jgi:hypothetical protein
MPLAFDGRSTFLGLDYLISAKAVEKAGEPLQLRVKMADGEPFHFEGAEAEALFSQLQAAALAQSACGLLGRPAPTANPETVVFGHSVLSRNHAGPSAGAPSGVGSATEGGKPE